MARRGGSECLSERPFTLISKSGIGSTSCDDSTFTVGQRCTVLPNPMPVFFSVAGIASPVRSSSFPNSITETRGSWRLEIHRRALRDMHELRNRGIITRLWRLRQLRRSDTSDADVRHSQCMKKVGSTKNITNGAFPFNRSLWQQCSVFAALCLPRAELQPREAGSGWNRRWQHRDAARFPR
jgi:hypothetical protein